MKYNNLIIIALLIILNVIGLGINNEPHLIIIDITIIVVYILFKPKYLIHPNNIVFAFSALYVIVPSVIYLVYEYLEITYILPWGKLYNWEALSKWTYVHALYMFVVPFTLFHNFTKNIKVIPYRQVYYKINIQYLIFLLIFIFCIIPVYVSLTGGVASYLYDYQTTYLIKRSGHGGLNLIIMYIGDLAVYLLGLSIVRYYGMKKFSILVISFALIVVISYIQGLKSRLIFLLLLFYLPYIQYYIITKRRVLALAIPFVVLLFIGNYFRSDGYYSNGYMFTEYMMSYFNVYPLHDMFMKFYDRNFFETYHHIFIKPLIKLGLVSSDTDYDLSVMLTKYFFPAQWENSKATQQWPVISELYINYFGMLFGWIPLTVYTYLLSLLYKKSMEGNLPLMLIYMIEFLRLFSTFRGVLLPWETPVFLLFYLLIYYLASRLIVRRKIVARCAL